MTIIRKKMNKMKKTMVEDMADLIEEGTTKMTVDDFFDRHKIPKNARSDYAYGILVHQAMELIQERKIPK